MPKNIAPQEWKFIPSLKGKHANRHIFILKTLMIKGPKSYCDLALAFLQQDPKFSTLTKASQYYEQRNQNTNFYRRCKFLEEKHYIKKFGSLYKLCGKGLFLVLAVDPKSLRNVKPAFLNDDAVDVDTLEKPEWMPREESQKNALFDATVKEVSSDPLAADIFSFTARKILLNYKINMDEISSQQLFELLNEKISKKIKK